MEIYKNERAAPPAEGELREYDLTGTTDHRVYRLPLGGGIYLELKASVVGCYDGYRSRPSGEHLHALRHALEAYLPEHLQTPIDPEEVIPATGVAGALDGLAETYRPKPPRPSRVEWSPDPGGLEAHLCGLEVFGFLSALLDPVRCVAL